MRETAALRRQIVQAVTCALPARRSTRGCNAWLWCTDAGGCLVEGGARLSKQACMLSHADMRPLPRPDPSSYTAANAPEVINRTIGFFSGESSAFVCVVLAVARPPGGLSTVTESLGLAALGRTAVAARYN